MALMLLVDWLVLELLGVLVDAVAGRCFSNIMPK